MFHNNFILKIKNEKKLKKKLFKLTSTYCSCLHCNWFCRESHKILSYSICHPFLFINQQFIHMFSFNNFINWLYWLEKKKIFYNFIPNKYTWIKIFRSNCFDKFIFKWLFLCFLLLQIDCSTWKLVYYLCF